MSQLNLKQQTTINWLHLNAYIKKKAIITNASGYASPGETLAIMGPSGAGKTTFLTMLACKKYQNLIVNGEIKANGVVFNQKSYYNFGSFVYQNDVLFEVLTVRENIEFAAYLKLRGSMQYKQKKVQQLIDQFGLSKCQNTYIGGRFIKGVSGGERKRTCIAIEFVSNPSVLILDEPTSGLDSTTAFTIVQKLQKLSQKGKTIIFTIHQPSSKIYNILNRLLILNKGETIYQGKAHNIVQYLQKLNILVPKHYNISDFFMFELSNYKKNLTKKETEFNSQNYSYLIEPGINTSEYNNAQSQYSAVGLEQIEPASNMFYQIFKLFQRSAKSYFRHPMNFRTMGFRLLANTFIISGIFFQVGSSSKPNDVISLQKLQNYLFNVQGAIFFAVQSNFMVGMFSVLLIFPIEREIYLKEESSKTYRPYSYFLGKALFEIPICILFSVLNGSIAYWMLDLNHSTHQFLIFILTIIIMTLAGNALGICSGCVFQETRKTVSIGGSVFLIPLMLVSGVYNRTDTMYPWIRWIQYISPFHYGFQALIYNQFSDQIFRVYTQIGIYDYNPVKQSNIMLNSFQNNGILFLILITYYIIGYLFLRYPINKK